MKKPLPLKTDIDRYYIVYNYNFNKNMITLTFPGGQVKLPRKLLTQNTNTQSFRAYPSESGMRVEDHIKLMLIDKYVVADVFKRDSLCQAMTYGHSTLKSPRSTAQRPGLIPQIRVYAGTHFLFETMSTRL